MTHVVARVEAALQATLVGTVAGASHVHLLEEDAGTAAERADAEAARDALRGALRLLDDVEHAAAAPARRDRDRDSLEEGPASPAPLVADDRRNTITERRRRDRSPGPAGMKPLSPSAPRKGVVSGLKENFLGKRR